MHYLSEAERQKRFNQLSVIARKIREYIEIPMHVSGLQWNGSMTLVRYRYAYFGLTTKHQFGGDDPANPSFNDPRNFRICLRRREIDFRTFNIYDYGTLIGRETDKEDLRIFDFTMPVQAGHYPCSHFMPMDSEGPTGYHRLCETLIIGYPGRLTPRDVDNYRPCSVQSASYLCDIGEKTADETVLKYKQVDASAQNADGMSGGGRHRVIQRR